MSMRQITSITFFRFSGFNMFWMFSQMQLSIGGFRKIKGLKFFKLMGSGSKNGFSKVLSLKVYALLCVWESESEAIAFFERSAHFDAFKSRANETWTVLMHNKSAHGSWSAQLPFTDFVPYTNGTIAVITRATIKLRLLPAFLKNVHAVSDILDKQEGLIFSIGIGEYPLLMQATFSLWDDYSFVKQYAYNTPEHVEVIRKTRELGWYHEELFANFVPYKSFGNWQGSDMLKGKLNIPE